MIQWQTLPRRRRPLAAKITLPVAGALAVGILSQALAPQLLVNESPSLPRGVYWRVWGAQPQVGSVVAVPQPGSARAYLSGLGMPDETLLIKRVVAAGSDPVCLVNGTLRFPSGRVPVLGTDRRGEPLPVWSGCRRLADDELFLLGDTDSSFDSRYFGPIDAAAIAGVYREGPTW